MSLKLCSNCWHEFEYQFSPNYQGDFCSSGCENEWLAKRRSTAEEVGAAFQE